MRLRTPLRIGAEIIIGYKKYRPAELVSASMYRNSKINLCCYYKKDADPEDSGQ
jgi:hypothetical protein